jgi:hypothetical protein
VAKGNGTAADAFEHAQRCRGKKEGRGSARCRVGAGEERRGRGRGAALCEPARHGRGGSGLLGQRRAAHIARAWQTRVNRGGGGRARRRGSDRQVGRDDAWPGV